MKINLKDPKNIILIFFFLFAISLGVGLYFYNSMHSQKESLEQNKEPSRQPCLSDNEIADFDYKAGLYDSTGVKLPSNATTTIFIKDKNTNEELFRFTITDVEINSPSLEIHKCGVYVMRNFDFDKKEGIHKRHELWRYTYDKKSEIILTNEVFFKIYGLSFLIDPSENYLTLTRYYQGHPDHAVVVKNLKTSQLEDVLIIRPDDIWQKLLQLRKERDVEAIGWSGDGKYLWGGSQQNLTDTAYFRININDKNKETLEVFPMPEDAVHYGPPRVDIGYIWYIYGAPWVGFYEMGEKIYDEWQKEGKKEILYLYNLFTKEKITLAAADDPRWTFKPRWLSDNKLRYQIPSGETKIYEIKPK